MTTATDQARSCPQQCTKLGRITLRKRLVEIGPGDNKYGLRGAIIDLQDKDHRKTICAITWSYFVRWPIAQLKHTSFPGSPATLSSFWCWRTLTEFRPTLATSNPSAMEDERFVRPKLEAGVGFSESVMSSVAEAVNKIKNALQENQQKEQQTYVSVTDAAFTERLEKAMLKNFDYLRR